MKTFSQILLCAALLTVSRTTAQETFAPLISENCIAFVHVDFRKVELGIIKTNLQKFSEDRLHALGFDAKSFKATSRELAVELDKLDALVRPAFDTLTKELGIREAAIIADIELFEQGIAGLLVIPWQNKTDKHITTLRTLLNLDDEVFGFAKVGDLLILSLNLIELEAAEKTVEDWAGKITHAPDALVYEALKSVSDAEIKVAVAVPESFRLLLQNNLAMLDGLNPDVPPPVGGFITFAAQKIDWASASLSIPPFFGGKPVEKSNVLLTIKMPQRADAMAFRSLAESLIEFGVNAARFDMEMQMQDKELKIPPVAFQFAKGFLRMLLPDVEEDKLVFRIKMDFGT